LLWRRGIRGRTSTGPTGCTNTDASLALLMAALRG
jgi:hypothetical protein